MNGQKPPPADAPVPITAAVPNSWIDLSIGAAQLGIRWPVLLEARILEEHAEVELRLGLNAAGVILTALACRLAVQPPAGKLVVCLRRRKDGQPIEVTLHLDLHRVDQRNWVRLRGN